MFNLFRFLFYAFNIIIRKNDYYSASSVSLNIFVINFVHFISLHVKEILWLLNGFGIIKIVLCYIQEFFIREIHSIKVAFFMVLILFYHFIFFILLFYHF